MHRTLRLAACAALSMALAPLAAAGRNDPGSLLVFPVLDSRPGVVSVVTVTNTAGAEVGVHLHYVEAADCSRSNAFELLTPFDTVTAVTEAHAPSLEQGYAYAYAVEGATPIAFDHLIGCQLVIDGISGSEHALNALVFEAIPAEGQPTDIDTDGVRDLDGVEYQPAPDRIAVPRFVGQSSAFRSELVLIDLTGSAFTTSVDFIVFNDNEEAFSAAHTFRCWTRVPLLSISGIFSQSFLANATDHDPGEVIGAPGIETGWFRVDGGVATSTTTTVVDPAVLAILVETGRLSSATLPFTLGEQTNGDLLPGGNGGDL